MRPRLILAPSMVLAVLALSPVPGWAQLPATPAGIEFMANTYTTGYQYSRANAVGMSADGRFVIAWESAQGGGYSIMARRWENTGAAMGVEFQVNTYTTGGQYFGAVAVNPRGRFAVSWQSYGQDGSQAGVYAQRYNRDGIRVGVEFRVNTYTTNTQSRASLGLDAVGNAIVTWRSAGIPAQDGDASGVHAQRYDFNGFTLGLEFRVNSYTTQYQNRPDVARVPGLNGNFVVVWHSNDQEAYGSGYGIFAQRYASDGTPAGGEFRVNSYTTGDQTYPSVGIDSAGNFVVAWADSALIDGAATGIRAQRFNAAGNPVASEFQVNTTTGGYQYLPQVGMASDGGAFVVAFTSTNTGVSRQVRARRYDAGGVPMGTDFLVNTFDTGYQYNGSIGMDPVGNFLVVWTSEAQDGSVSSVHGQRFGVLLPSVLLMDPANGGGTGDHNSVWEPGESVDMRPSWRNLNGATQTFAGAITNLTGPAGPTYTINDPNANYGAVLNGNVGSCTATNNCYRVQVNNAARPLQHWDATVLETISPVTQGQQKRWALHIGDSFTDVPRGNGFYRFIEALLHHGIAGGCGGASYCPTDSTTREQMAVFVLVAKEGPGYLPPPCVPPNIFSDVPETSPFCRWIEELSLRGVVSGCGGSSYCPSTAVTREQMAIFVLRTLDPALNPPACVAPNLFNDVPASSPFCRWIEELANRAVVTGCGGGNYCPLDPVTRAQMGVFITSTFGLTLYGP